MSRSIPTLQDLYATRTNILDKTVPIEYGNSLKAIVNGYLLSMLSESYDSRPPVTEIQEAFVDILKRVNNLDTVLKTFEMAIDVVKYSLKSITSEGDNDKSITDHSSSMSIETTTSVVISLNH